MINKDRNLDFYKYEVVRLVEEVKSNNQGKVDWDKISELFRNLYPKESSHKERLRSLYRSVKDKKYIAYQNTSRLVADELKGDETPIEEKVLKFLTSKVKIVTIAIRLGIKPEVVKSILANLLFRGYDIILWTEGGVEYAQFSRQAIKGVTRSKEHCFNIPSKEFKIGLISDTHYGNKSSAEEESIDYIHYLYNQGVRKIFHFGDIVEGHYMGNRPDAIYELKPNAIGFDAQLELASKNLPQLPGLEYYIITGNHDYTFTRNTGANIGKVLSTIRDDIIYFGHNEAKVYLTKNLSLMLIHPTDGIGQNYSLKMRQHIDKNDKERLGDIIGMGHYHKYDHTHYKGIHGFILPSFVKQTNFMKYNNLPSVVGGIMLIIKVDEEGYLTNLVTETKFYENK